MGSKKDKKSPAIQLMDLVWEYATGEGAQGWEQYNNALRQALTLAVGSGMTLDEDDIQKVFDGYRCGRWIGESHEWVYTCAIVNGNMSAIVSYEKAVGRKGFIADQVDVAGWGAMKFVHMAGRRQRERLHVGAKFQWKGCQARVTSFAKDGESLTACSYKYVDPDAQYPQEKVDKRFRITRQDIIDDRAARKLAKVVAVESEPGAVKP